MSKFITLILLNLFLAPLVHAGLPNFQPLIDSDFRTYDGTYNNKMETLYGAAETPLFRRVPPAYTGHHGLAGYGQKSAREISNIVCATSKSILNDKKLSDYLWQWGQFLDHDIDLTVGHTKPVEDKFGILIPLDDYIFNPMMKEDQYMSFHRSNYVNVKGVRQQVNSITAFIDASNVYGSDPSRAFKLREDKGDTALLKTSTGNLLPFNIHGLPNAPASTPNFFLAGDIRANEQVGLISMHTLFMREHNYLVRQIRKRHPDLEDNKVYLMARSIVGAELQAITYNEFLPALLGGIKRVRFGSDRFYPLKPYYGYKKNVRPDIANVFSTAAYRYGHSNLSPMILRLDKNLKEISYGHLSLKDAFFTPETIITEGGIGPILLGLAHQVSQNIDVKVNDALRNFLFGPPPMGFDLAALNIQRGRDHGLPPYNTVRQAYGLKRKRTWSEITKDEDIQKKLKAAYNSVDDIDMWIGSLAEDHYKEAQVGQLNYHIIKDQFERLRDGDRHFYEISLPRTWVDWVNSQTLKGIIVRNTEISSRQLQNNVFFAKSLDGGRRRR